MPSARTKKERHAWNRFADIGRAILVGSATALPGRSPASRARSCACLAAVKLIEAALKRAVPERRPDGHDDKSFPSEHAAESVAAALILDRQYSANVGRLACTLASAVAVSRIASRRHYPHDVLAGALVGAASVWLFFRIHRALDRPLTHLE